MARASGREPPRARRLSAILQVFPSYRWPRLVSQLRYASFFGGRRRRKEERRRSDEGEQREKGRGREEVSEPPRARRLSAILQVFPSYGWPRLVSQLWYASFFRGGGAGGGGEGVGEEARE